MKRYIISSLVTFFAAFTMYFVTVIDDVTIESFTNGALMAILFVGLRAGIKAVLEASITLLATKYPDEEK